MSHQENLRLLKIYKKLKKCISFEEKLWLLSFEGNLMTYEEKLLKLAERYKIPIEEK